MSHALVLAGGGVAGIAWELGVLHGLDPAVADRIIEADLIVGTSAGSAVAAQITSGTPLDVLYRRQLDTGTAEIEPGVSLTELIERIGSALASGGEPEEQRRRVGAMATATVTVAPEVRRAAIAARLPRDSWPDQDMVLTAVDVETGEGAEFRRTSPVSLVDAVAASCAVPGVWPPVRIGDRHYMDGGLRSGSNLDLAAGHDRILLIIPALADAPEVWGPGLGDQIAALSPSQVYVISADQHSIDAFGANPLSPDTRAASAEAGRAVGERHAAGVAAFWN